MLDLEVALAPELEHPNFQDWVFSISKVLISLLKKSLFSSKQFQSIKILIKCIWLSFSIYD